MPVPLEPMKSVYVYTAGHQRSGKSGGLFCLGKSVLYVSALGAGSVGSGPTFVRSSVLILLQCSKHLSWQARIVCICMQDQDFLDMCSSIISHAVSDTALALHDDAAALHDAEVRHVGRCVQQLLVDVGYYLPHVCTMAATSGALELLASPKRRQLPDAVFEALCGLFVSQETLPGILASAFLQTGTPFKGRTPSCLLVLREPGAHAPH